MAAIAGGLTLFSYDFLIPVLAIALSGLELNQDQIAYFFCIIEIPYMASSFLMPSLTEKYCKRISNKMKIHKIGLSH